MVASGTYCNPNLHSDAPPTSCEYVGEGGTLARLLKLGGRRRRTNRRAPPLNQAHLSTHPPHAWPDGLSPEYRLPVQIATIIDILMAPPPVVNTWVRGGT